MAPEPTSSDVVQSAVARWFTDELRHGFFATDRQFRVIAWNHWMEVHSGYSAAQAEGRLIFELFEDLAARGLDEYYQNALTGHVTISSHGLHRYLLPLAATNASLPFGQMPQSGHIGPLSNGTEIIGTVTVLEDVSERLATEAELRTQIEAQRVATATAEAASRAKDEFLSTLSHEIRAPLNAVLGWVRILLARDEVDAELLERALHIIERNAAAQAKMIDDMLDMARIVAGKLRLDMRPVDLASVVLASVDVVKPAANAKRISVETWLGPQTPHVMGDQDRLQQAVWNLLSNAVKFTEAGGAVDVRLETAGDIVRISVRDTGQGITEEFLPHAFERFRQNDPSSSRRHGGLGLGLALVRELVELHGGTVSVTSAGPGKGSSFSIELPTTLPAELPRQGASDYPSASWLAPSLDGVRVLVVDDEADARELTVRVLEHNGACVVAAVSSGAAAIAALESAAAEAFPNVLVSDLGMPNEDGYELIRQVRLLAADRGGAIPAISLSGYATPADVERALAAGYQAHIRKPMDPETLVRTVARLAAADNPATRTSVGPRKARRT
ncbi:MAG TPA: ATP-binding protein [Vicinamibacterales bacterium]|nr:ATP-binding protein [Vicinamibacterales bacterium]